MNLGAEHDRQQALVQALWDRSGTPPPGLRAHRMARGLAAYEANAAGSAERALAGTYPTVQALLGEEPFGHLAQVLWRAHPPVHGDLDAWGHDLPAFMAADPTLADWPYLADVARLDAAVARCATASDGEAEPATLARLGDTDAARLVLQLAAGVGVVASPFPVVTLWQAHRADAPAGSFTRAREALAASQAECALVWRSGWRPAVSALDEPAGRFTAAVSEGLPLARALQEAGESFAFEPWLIAAVRDGWLWHVRVLG